MQGDGGVDGVACKKIKSFSLRGTKQPRRHVSRTMHTGYSITRG